MATSYAPLIAQILDNYGELEAGGTIETYEAGTTTPLATYQDLSGSIPNTNPIVLDAAARAVVRVTNGVAYKFVFKTNDGVTLFTLDNIIIGTSTSASGQTLIANMTYEGTPGAQGFMGGVILLDAVTFPVDFEGGEGSVETNPGSDFVISVRKNGAEIGTATVSTTGAYTLATTGHTTVAFAVGDKLSFIGPDTVGTAADFILTLEGALA
jgi:hypothetical protein